VKRAEFQHNEAYIILGSLKKSISVLFGKKIRKWFDPMKIKKMRFNKWGRVLVVSPGVVFLNNLPEKFEANVVLTNIKRCK